MSKFRLSADYLPDAVVNQLSRKAQKVLRVLSQIFNRRKEVIALEYAHITPSLDYLARRTGETRYQVSRAISELKAAGLIHRRQQRTAAGEWRINVFTLGKHFKTLWQAFKDKKILNKIAGLHNSANIDNKEPLEDNYFAEFCKIWRNKGIGGLASAPLPAI